MTGRSRARDRSRPSGGAVTQTLLDTLLALGPCELCLLATADQIVTGTGVSQWTDQSGHGRHATQATGALQPAYTAIAGDVGYVQGNGSQYLTISPTGLAFFHSGTGLTLLVVLDQGGTVDNYLLGQQVVTGANKGFALSRRPTPNLRVNAGNGGTGTLLTTAPIGADGSWHKVSIRYATASSPQLDVRSDGASATTGSETGTPSLTDAVPLFGVCAGGGGAYPTTVKFRAIVAYSSRLDDTTVGQIEAAFSSAWGV